MVVFVVTEEYCTGLYGVFSTRELAEQYIADTHTYWGELEIHEMTVDTTPKYHPKK